MLYRFCVFVFLLTVSQLSFSAGASNNSPAVAGDGFSDYRLGAGDLLGIQVFGEDDLSVEVRMSDAGTISYPFLGELRVQGMTIGALSELITNQLLDGYLVNPSVNITVLEYREFYIDGAVKKPGAYPYQPGLTLQRAVSLAGGFTERASSSKFYISHEGSTSNNKSVRAKLGSPVAPGDVINIEESFF
ncbi:polysaccharide biosynthesis/export family protein [Neptunomonas qingdaonensis]|uniref:Polysaccharide export outer membrane protein n=1 Tax=Neptunomonas qingdaonensis TaxID=1045558 RepID=A0A1I2VRK6_9GAMM|nr:polysaccharide biosynthesis/export family protein [Neptunomonas qingdaonensis]SFG91868.1 polysaccharide export outer membrane protein [Neptunomonas qingdaonensis]